MRLYAILAAALVPAWITATPATYGSPTRFATAADAARFLRDTLGMDNPGGPLAIAGRRLATQLAQGFDVRVEDSAGAEDLGDDLDDVRPDAEVDGFRPAPHAPVAKTADETLPSQRALAELNRAFESGVMSRTVRRTLNRLSKQEGATPLPVRVAILRVRTDRREYRALIDALSRDILAAATAELQQTNQQLGIAEEEKVVVAERVPAAARNIHTDEDPASLPAWPWLLGCAAAVLALSMGNLLRTRRRYEVTQPGAQTPSFDEADRFDSVTQVRPVRPGIHERNDRDN